ncbi:3-(cis-5,6-dihydroxycyclohexa-1,3-dien-1-yl)propanoate dehydrogenase [Pseudonocardia sp. H11422]|uniref:3-(cis-5,6-dihydroxycyclohexa-1, 3-dien-1-yl)propanoate dehydrogenase n=1 Tax=Pseudonocardia sp. H11422 TaxID=2835866 RepID=UPI001BDD972E|nr:3-(cis-5,6-dihydroxycyclohexa-1,3-dien-1-yl)propanoate dehydrogenase [Pseudonocardia sp. H11422]
MGWLEGRAALVTGGASGIGRAVVERFLAEGARVAVLDSSGMNIAAMQGHFPDLVMVEGDVSSLEDNERAVAATVEAHGGLDTFIGNAGIFDYFAPVATTPGATLASSFDEIFAVNVKGYLLGVKAALPALLESTSPSIVFTLSNGAFLPAGGGTVYTASKHAAVGLIRQLAYELAPRVRVNGVAPGGTLTDLRGASSLGHAETSLLDVPDFPDLVRATNPLGIVQQPADHTGPYVLLASPENAAAVTGVVINSDGGMQVRGLAQSAGGTDL